MSRLSHPNCVSVIDFGVEGAPYLVMDYVTGTTLREVLEHGRLAPARAVGFARQLLAAMSHAHAQGIIHRDLKPENLLLSETAIIDSKPTLEIHTDDVKCNHGSTIGQIADEPLFYLRSRGLGEDEARSLLIYAFAGEIVDRMKIPAVQEQIRRALFEQMPERLPERREGRR